jgi:hypothetical protein
MLRIISAVHEFFGQPSYDPIKTVNASVKNSNVDDPSRTTTDIAPSLYLTLTTCDQVS